MVAEVKVGSMAAFGEAGKSAGGAQEVASAVEARVGDPQEGRAVVVSSHRLERAEAAVA